MADTRRRVVEHKVGLGALRTLGMREAEVVLELLTVRDWEPDTKADMYAALPFNESTWKAVEEEGEAVAALTGQQ